MSIYSRFYGHTPPTDWTTDPFYHLFAIANEQTIFHFAICIYRSVVRLATIECQRKKNEKESTSFVMQMRWWKIDNNWLNANCQRWEGTLIKLEKTITINENDKVKINYAQDREQRRDRDADAIIYLKAIPLSKSYMYLKSIAARISTLNVTFHLANKKTMCKKRRQNKHLQLLRKFGVLDARILVCQFVENECKFSSNNNDLLLVIAIYHYSQLCIGNATEYFASIRVKQNDIGNSSKFAQKHFSVCRKLSEYKFDQSMGMKVTGFCRHHDQPKHPKIDRYIKSCQ